uniref:Uncharacterized protein n=2 Tax=Ciona intestinalis TaxID=7719 RepID=F6VUC5_CIOIN
MEVPIGRAVVVASFNYKCVTEVPAKIEWNGQMKEINTAIVRNQKITDELMEAFINKAGTAAAVCLVFYKLYPRAHTFKYEGLTDEKSLQFELCSFLSEFNSMKEKLLSGKLAEEINDEARTLFPDSLSSARGLKLTLKIRETITPKPKKRTGKPAAKARSENDKTEHIRGSVRSENTLDDDIDLSKNTTQSTSTTAPTPGASGSSKPTTDFVATESTTQATDFENFDLKFAFQEEDAENYWSRKEYGKAIPFFENILRRSSYKGRHSGVIMLKLSLCKLKLNEVAEGADLYIQGYKQIETDEQSDHTTATQLCEVAKIYAEEDFPRRSFLTFTCIMVIVRRCIEQRRLRVYMDVLSSITPL